MSSQRWLAFTGCLLGMALTAANPHTAAGQTNYYIDGGLGNNTYDGLTNIVVNGHGPKLNIANAISAAPSGNVLVVAPDYYQEVLWELSTKNLTMNLQGLAVIYDTNPWQTDSIGDGISDGWRQYYFGGSTTTNGSSCASCDPDGDGYSNLQEFLFGTNPSDTNSPGLRNLFFYDNLGRLAVVIATNATDAAFYDYDAVGNITTIRRQTVGAVNLFEFSPATGSGGTTITLQGTGFSSLPANDTVLFGSITAKVVNASANQLQVLVPTNAVSSLISVSTPLGVSTNSGTFTAGIGVSISPSAVTLSGTFGQQFAATVSGTTTQNVTWTINGWIPAGTNTLLGMVTTGGLYTAPTNPPPSGAVMVQAQSVVDADPLKAGVATITIFSPRGAIYSPTVSAQPGLPPGVGPIYSSTVSAQPGLPPGIGPIYSPTVSVGTYP